MSEKRICPYSGVEFVPKRSNQVFANRENQIRFNNKKAFQKRKAKSLTDNALDKNRQVLKSVLSNMNHVIKSYDYLLGAGLHFGYSTHQIIKDEIKWVCIYDYAYTLIDTNKFKIVCLNQKTN